MATISSPWVGNAKGKLGEGVYYRQGGKTIARSRNRSPKNPNSSGQLIQRAITATVLKAYSAGIKIFDHSFQGQSVPAGSQRKFMSENMKLLRAAIETDSRLSNPANECEGIVVARGAISPVPFAYKVSEGSLVQNLFAVVSAQAENADIVRPGVQMIVTTAQKAMSVSAFLASKGIAAGDIFTIVAFGCPDVSAYRANHAQAVSRFGFVRLIVKDSAVADTTTLMSAASFATLFDVDSDGVQLTLPTTVDAVVDLNMVVESAQFGAMGTIRSREDSGMRSTCILEYASADVDYIPQWGVKSTALVAAWRIKAPEIGKSDLILEGGNF